MVGHTKALLMTRSDNAQARVSCCAEDDHKDVDIVLEKMIELELIRLESLHSFDSDHRVTLGRKTR